MKSKKNTKKQRTLAYDPRYALNAICPYFTMFPLEYPLRILKNHKKNKPVVLDPFCGRGTTIYAARTLGLSSWGIDTSPIAVAIAQAKLATGRTDEIISLAEEFINEEPKDIPDTNFFKRAYAPRTLKEICSLREGLLNIKQETGASILLRAASLGCLHGPLNKGIETASYFSNQMPRTFSSKPNYSVKFWKKKNLDPPDVRVIDVLQRKLSRIKDINVATQGEPNQVICEDARNSTSYQSLSSDVSVVITSPPYYGMRTYEEDQWLRFWFLGGPDTVVYGNKKQIDHNGQDAFINDLASVWKNLLTFNTNKLDLYVRFGTVPSVKSDAKEIMKCSLESCGNWRLVSVRNAKDAHAGKRQATQMVTMSKATQEYDFHAIKI